LSATDLPLASANWNAGAFFPSSTAPTFFAAEAFGFDFVDPFGAVFLILDFFEDGIAIHLVAPKG
jgi:hypothetical protein